MKVTKGGDGRGASEERALGDILAEQIGLIRQHRGANIIILQLTLLIASPF